MAPVEKLGNLKRRHASAMLQETLKSFEDILETMANFELALADLYRACSQVWERDKEFWTRMQLSEVKHAQNLGSIKKIVLERPERFQFGRSFKPAAIQTSITGIRWNIRRLEKKEIGARNMLFISRDLEQSMLESHYGEVIKSDDPEFQSILKEILLDTLAHREHLKEKIRQTASNPDPLRRDESHRMSS